MPDADRSGDLPGQGRLRAWIKWRPRSDRQNLYPQDIPGRLEQNAGINSPRERDHDTGIGSEDRFQFPEFGVGIFFHSIADLKFPPMAGFLIISFFLFCKDVPWYSG
jgi:hypothetical protein